MVNGIPCTCASDAAYWFFASSRIAKIPACDWPMRSRSRKSGSNPVALKTRAFGKRLGAARARSRFGLDHPHADPLVEERARDRRADPPGAVDDDVRDRRLPRARAARSTPWRPAGEPITTIRSPGADRVVAAGKDRRRRRG